MVLLFSLQIDPTPLRAFGSGHTQKAEREKKNCGKYNKIIIWMISVKVLSYLTKATSWEYCTNILIIVTKEEKRQLHLNPWKQKFVIQSGLK